jgi:hypothetical protein
VLACWSAPWAAGFWLIGNFRCERRPPIRGSAGGLHSEPKRAWAECVDCAIKGHSRAASDEPQRDTARLSVDLGLGCWWSSKDQAHRRRITPPDCRPRRNCPPARATTEAGPVRIRRCESCAIQMFQRRVIAGTAWASSDSECEFDPIWEDEKAYPARYARIGEGRFRRRACEWAASTSIRCKDRRPEHVR